jgi:hypothetical protein
MPLTFYGEEPFDEEEDQGVNEEQKEYQ